VDRVDLKGDGRGLRHWQHGQRGCGGGGRVDRGALYRARRGGPRTLPPAAARPQPQERLVFRSRRKHAAGHDARHPGDRVHAGTRRAAPIAWHPTGAL
jgi:hypothetical protein